ncbi:hypothetical protein EGH24_06955 [Halonotius terrestris]|uniref:PGF-CTERM sorting domain-containing protein n=1 Tax=Halonotius terrestris TaxID=2487750 RepID=A0A8J8P8X6_9EURY|nr:Hvo_1808 family surface protein [Halonotius terrestris]TQQ80891.1 hypothetical protein EGH24_06955 [Halonotius terrestris]
MKRPAVGCCVLLCLVVAALPVAAAAQPADSGTTVHQADDLLVDDTLGCVDGVCHDDRLNFSQADGLTDRELELLIDRSMARVEVIRGERFESDVPVRVTDTETFSREQLSANESNLMFNRWNDQVWEALFIVGENSSSETEITQTLTGSVNGLYSPRNDEIIIVTENPDAPRISEKTLIHELMHALQDQRHNLGSPQFVGDTQDEDLAVTGLYEGVTGYVEARYEERCTDGRWRCFDVRPPGGSGGPTNRGILTTVLQPYSNGPAYVHEIVTEEGWDGIDEQMNEPPETTTEIIHREPVEPQPIDLADTATGDWQRYPGQGRDGAEVAGEASIFVMFWYQAATNGADTVDPEVLYETGDNPYNRRNYIAEPSAGWVSDELYPYRRGDDDGYVWALEWETAEDAIEFQNAYGEILAAYDANETAPGIYVVDDGGFSGAYAVDVDGTRVTIVHAPTTEGLFELRPDLDPDATTDSLPGFGIGTALTALVALGSATFVARRRS